MPRKTVLPEQMAANRANAARSTGPRTPEGKARSAQNARKHGFTASNFAVVRLEELDEVARLKEDLVAVYRPANAQELFAVERIALAQQALLRAARLESGLFTFFLDEALDRTSGEPFTPMTPDLAGDGDIEITRAQNRNLALATGFHRTIKQSNAWPLFLRYQAQSERLYRRAIEDFERLRSLAQREETAGPDPGETNPSGATAEPADAQPVASAASATLPRPPAPGPRPLAPDPHTAPQNPAPIAGASEATRHTTLAPSP